MKFSPITQKALISASYWRAECQESLRTPFLLNELDQVKFYESLSIRNDIKMFNILTNDNELIGICGLVNICLVNRIGEISLMIDPTRRDEGFGREAFELLLEQGFDRLGLINIYGECYECSPSFDFWEKIVKEDSNNKSVTLPERKYFKGKFWDSMYFNFKSPHSRTESSETMSFTCI